MAPEPVMRVTAPTLPAASAPYTFPLVATLAPVALSGVAWWLTQSVLSLVFAALGPLIAIGSLLDARLQSRRRRRREAERFSRELESARAEVDAALEAERARREAEHPRMPPAARWARSGGDSREVAVPVRLGLGPVPSSVLLEGVAPTSRSPSPESLRLEHLVEHGSVLVDAPVVIDARAGLGIVGPRLSATALARSVVIQLAARLSPADWRLETRAGSEWAWLELLPHVTDDTAMAFGDGTLLFWTNGSETISIAVAEKTIDLPAGLGESVELAGERLARAERLSVEEARAFAESLARQAVERGVGDASDRLPESVAFAGLAQPSVGLAAVIGVGALGPAVIDIVRDGPHAIVGGTTGSGKSELLISWLLALASTRSPDAVTMLLVDFKGGSAFGALATLPHCVGVVTDLDDDTAQRALDSLAAELRYRERALAAAGVRSIDELPNLARLLIVVDEFAAVTQGFPHLHALFSDLAARGRSLGIHLVLCTQRPAGVVRDTVLANSGLRISLRVNNRSDSTAVIGVDDAAHLPAAARGRALLSAHGEKPIAVQLALATPADVRAVHDRWRSGFRQPRRPWCDPLPSRVTVAELGGPASGEGEPGIPFALADHPDEQSQPTAFWMPHEHGHLMVVGGSGSGRTATLDTLASGVGGRYGANGGLAAPSELGTNGDLGAHGDLGALRLSARSAEAAWDVVSGLLERARGDRATRATLLIDDLDALVARLGEDHRAEFVDRLAALLREGQARGIHVVFSVQRVGGSLGGVAALAGSRLLLRLPDRQEHVLAGGTGESFRERLPPGAALWRGRRVQVAVGPTGRAADERPTVIRFDPATQPVFAVVSSRPGDTGSRLAAAGVVNIAQDSTILSVRSGEGEVLLADPERWQAQWGAIAGLRARIPILFDGCSIAEYRALTRDRQLPPPLRPGSGQLWLLTPDGAVTRANLAAGERPDQDRTGAQAFP